VIKNAGQRRVSKSIPLLQGYWLQGFRLSSPLGCANNPGSFGSPENNSPSGEIVVGCAYTNAKAETSQRAKIPMKESTLAKITAAATAAKRTAQKALAANPNPEWTEHEMQSIDEWIAHQEVKIERSEAIRRLVELGLKAKGK
jgi:hypothetical protein